MRSAGGKWAWASTLQAPRGGAKARAFTASSFVNLNRSCGAKRRRITALFLAVVQGVLGSQYRARVRASNLVSPRSRWPRSSELHQSTQLAAGKTLASKTNRGMQPLEYHSVRYWSKEIDGTRIGGRKRNFFNSPRPISHAILRIIYNKKSYANRLASRSPSSGENDDESPES